MPACTESVGTVHGPAALPLSSMKYDWDTTSTLHRLEICRCLCVFLSSFKQTLQRLFSQNIYRFFQACISELSLMPQALTLIIYRSKI